MMDILDQITASPPLPCCCCDHLCPAHPGEDCGAQGEETLVRIDMDDGEMSFCESCAVDALRSGVFASVDSLDLEERLDAGGLG